MKMHRIRLTLPLICLIAGCQLNHSLRQGVQGQVIWYEGDRMPGINKKKVEGKPVQRVILIYEPTHLSDVMPSYGTSFTKIRTRRIASIKSDNKGFFSINLKKGIYSVFVLEGKKYYSNVLDGSGNLYPVEVKKGSVTRIDIKIDYNATY
jgi:hypothetical protein